MDAPFQLTGDTITFTAATTAPTAVQASSSVSGVATQNYILTNVGAVPAFVGWGQTAVEAQANSIVPTGTPTRCYPLLAGTQVAITAMPNAYFSGDTGSSTAIIYVSPGIGF